VLGGWLMIEIAAIMGTLAILLAAFVTIRVCISNLQNRSPEQVSPFWIALLECMRDVVVTLAFLTVLIGFHHPVTAIAVVVMIAVCMSASVARFNEESRSLNDLIRLVTDRGGFLPDALDAFATSCRSKVGRRTRQFAHLLRCGESTAQAIHRSQAPVEADAVLAIQTSSHGSAPASGKAFHRMHIATRERTSDVGWQSWEVNAQAAYLFTLVAFCLLLGFFVRSMIVPTLEKIGEEFSFGRGPLEDWLPTLLDYASTLSTLVCVLGAVWWLMMGLVDLFPTRWMTRITPLYGNVFRTRHQVQGLRMLSLGTQRGQALTELLETASKTARQKWIRWRSAATAKRLSYGEPDAVALHRTGWITKSESQWLRAASENGNLPLALGQLADDIERRHDLRWRIRMAWLAPLVIVLVGAFVFLHALYLFVVTTGFIHGLA